MSGLGMGRALAVLPSKRKITVFRPAGAWVDGRWVDRAGDESITKTGRAVVQPAQPRDLRNLPEGADASDAVLIHWKEPLQTVEESDQSGADIVEVDGMGRYKILSVGPWNQHGFYRYVAGSVQ